MGTSPWWDGECFVTLWHESWDLVLGFFETLLLHTHNTNTQLMDYFNQIKTSVIGLSSAVMAFLAPLAADLYVMLILFAVNALFGIIADVVDGKKWDKHKIQVAFIEALLFFLFVLIIYSIGTIKANMDGALQCVSFISYSLMYYYGTNITRNMMNILPDGSVGHACFGFIYYLLSVEFIKKIPALKEYLKGNVNDNLNVNLNPNENLNPNPNEDEDENEDD